MSSSAVMAYARNIVAHVPWAHWIVIGVLALVVFLLTLRKHTMYGSIMMGLAVFVGLSLLDAAVFIRYSGFFPHAAGISLNIFNWGEMRSIELLSNVAVFVPIGFFLSEFLVSTKRITAWRRIWHAVLTGFGLSLCIECLQLVLRVGFFEVTDLVMNTVGAYIGALLSALTSAVFRKSARHASP